MRTEECSNGTQGIYDVANIDQKLCRWQCSLSALILHLYRCICTVAKFRSRQLSFFLQRHRARRALCLLSVVLLGIFSLPKQCSWTLFYCGVIRVVHAVAATGFPDTYCIIPSLAASCDISYCGQSSFPPPNPSHPPQAHIPKNLLGTSTDWHPRHHHYQLFSLLHGVWEKQVQTIHQRYLSFFFL